MRPPRSDTKPISQMLGGSQVIGHQRDGVSEAIRLTVPPRQESYETLIGYRKQFLHPTIIARSSQRRRFDYTVVDPRLQPNEIALPPRVTDGAISRNLAGVTGELLQWFSIHIDPQLRTLGQHVVHVGHTPVRTSTHSVLIVLNIKHRLTDMRVTSQEGCRMSFDVIEVLRCSTGNVRDELRRTVRSTRKWNLFDANVKNSRAPSRPILRKVRCHIREVAAVMHKDRGVACEHIVGVASLRWSRSVHGADHVIYLHGWRGGHPDRIG